VKRGALLDRLDERRARWWLAAFFAALALPAAALVAQAYGQLKWQAFRNAELLAEDLVARVDADLRERVAAEEARSFGEYAFLVVEGDAAANFVQRSPLSAYPVASALPGVVSYFQVDANGLLTTPLLPPAGIDAGAYGIGADEAAARRALEQTIRDVLAQNRLVERPARSPPAAALRTQAAFDELARASALSPRARPAVDERGAGLRAEAPKAESAARETAAASSAPAAEAERQKRTEQLLVPETPTVLQNSIAPAGAEFRIRTFASERDPFELGMLDTGQMVLFRNAWRDGQRYIQGLLLDRAVLIEELIEAAFRASAVSSASVLRLRYRGDLLGDIAEPSGARDERRGLAGTVLQRARLSPPFGDLELELAVTSLPRTPGTVLLVWVSVTLAALLVGGFLFMYRFAVGQIRLTRQQQDFVSAVSHELKTPLTSIRMYGEMLKAGWAEDAKRQTYYDYIHAESERLSRLIENVLQLARLTRSTQQFEPKRIAVSELIDLARSKVATQVERAGFTLDVRDTTPAGTQVTLDPDCFAQIIINLVDNAVKFSAGAERKTVEVASRRETDGTVLFTVRDYGPGIPKGQMKKIFELFYRPANELTRGTVGTGIGLALARELCAAMGGRIDVRNREPGAEFRLSFAGT
jgi:signal transduction histidine kinase